MMPEPSVTFARKKRALLVAVGTSMDFKFAPPAPISRLDMAWLDSLGFAANNSSVTLLAAWDCASAMPEARRAVSKMDLLANRFMVVPPPPTLVGGNELQLKIQRL